MSSYVKIKKQNLYLSAVIILLVFAAYSQGSQIQTEGKSVNISQQSQLVKGFIEANPNYETGIEILDRKNITELSEKYPVIYGDLPDKALYQIRYSSGVKGILVIMDMENEEVLKEFMVSDVAI